MVICRNCLCHSPSIYGIFEVSKAEANELIIKFFSIKKKEPNNDTRRGKVAISI